MRGLGGDWGAQFKPHHLPSPFPIILYYELDHTNKRLHKATCQVYTITIIKWSPGYPPATIRLLLLPLGPRLSRPQHLPPPPSGSTSLLNLRLTILLSGYLLFIILASPRLTSLSNRLCIVPVFRLLKKRFFLCSL